jgi:N-acetylglutamate synthase-like GNAT family acetyltransferase
VPLRHDDGNAVMAGALRLIATPLAPWERDGLRAALAKAGLPVDDINDPRLHFWRFETYEDVPVGFGGLEIHDSDAVLRSIVTLPPLRQLGMGGAILAKLEDEARAHRCRAIYLVTTSEEEFFADHGYAPCKRNEVPAAVRASGEFAALPPSASVVMVKQLG